MKALRWEGQQVVLDPKASQPAAGVGEAVVRPTRMGVSTFDAAAAMGRSAPQRLILGHEFVGVVESLGDGADRDLRARWEGRRVVGSVGIACAKCDLCRAGLGDHCRALRLLGMRGWDGCFAERFRLPIRNLVEVPRGLDDDQAVFAWPLACGAHVAQLLRVEGKPYVTVLGDGVPGLLCAQVLAKLNASVRLLGVDSAKFSLCERWGIKHRHIGEVGRRADQDIVVDATGQGLELAAQLVRPRGKVVLTGAQTAGSAAALAAVVEYEIEVLGSRGGSPAEAIAMLGRAEVDVLPLITKRVRLGEGCAALAAASRPEALKVLIEP